MGLLYILAINVNDSRKGNGNSRKIEKKHIIISVFCLFSMKNT